MRRRTSRHMEWVVQTVRIGPLGLMRWRTQASDAYGTSDGPYQLRQVWWDLGRWSLMVQRREGA